MSGWMRCQAKRSEPLIYLNWRGDSAQMCACSRAPDLLESYSTGLGGALPHPPSEVPPAPLLPLRHHSTKLSDAWKQQEMGMVLVDPRRTSAAGNGDQSHEVWWVRVGPEHLTFGRQLRMHGAAHGRCSPLGLTTEQ